VRPALWLKGYQTFFKDDTKPAEEEAWPPETEPTKQQLLRKIPAIENAEYIYHEGYVYFIPDEKISKLMKARSDGKEIKELYSTGNERGSSGGWHRSEKNSFKIEKKDDGYLYLEENNSGDNDYSDWDDTYIHRIKLDGSDKVLKYKISRFRNDPGGGENFTQYYDDEGNPKD